MNERQNGQLPPAKRMIRSRISPERWEQIKTAYAAGIGLRELARKMKIPEGTVLAHAKRQGWTQQIQVATGELATMQSDAIAEVQSVPQSLAAILQEHERETKLSLARSARRMAKDAEQATLRESLYVHKAAQVASITHGWGEKEKNPNSILNLAVLIGNEQPTRASMASNQDSEGQDSGD
jgi:uncharacterized protein YjcR